MSSTVQWLMTSSSGTRYFLTVIASRSQQGSTLFSIVTYLNTSRAGDDAFQKYLQKHLGSEAGPEVQNPKGATPMKPQKAVDAAAPTVESTASFAKRRKVESQ